MKYRIQLASNYQVVELEVENADKTNPEIQKAIDLVNFLGETVQNDKNQKNNKSKKEQTNMATDKQKRLLDSLGIDYNSDLTRQDAWLLIQKNQA